MSLYANNHSTFLSRHVLSAGSCVSANPEVTALLGASNILDIKEIIFVDSVTIHDDFRNWSLDNDIAILRLAREALLSDEVEIARLPRFSDESESFTDVIAAVAGWGSTEDKNEYVPTQYLMTVRGQVITNFSCTLRYPIYISRTNICTNVVIGTPCTGDEGGALTYVEHDRYRTQIGIYSYQFSISCDLSWPAVYTRTSQYLQWIQSNSDAEIRN